MGVKTMDFKSWVICRRYQIMFFVLLLAIFLVSCGTGQGSAPPSGPIGGGCG